MNPQRADSRDEVSTDRPRMDVQITLRSPVRADAETPLADHTRYLKDVPFRIAELMATDFACFEEGDGASGRRKLYTYDSLGPNDEETAAAEVLVALDFGDVRFLEVVPAG